jgi:hypothetical protein
MERYTHVVILFALSIGAVFGQIDQASLNGSVTDTSGSFVPKARVELVSPSTGFAREVDTESSGVYSFSGIPIGTYNLKISHEGFRTFQATGIELFVGQTRTVDAKLEVGAIATQVEVQAEAAALETSKKTGLPRYQSLQPNYNLYDRAEFEAQLEPLCMKEGLGVINYFPLAAGFLSGKYRSESDMANKARARMVKKYLNPRGLKILDALDAVAKKYNATPARVSLAWLLARPSITAPIVSATNLEQLSDLIASVELKLDQPSVELLNQASAPAANAAN